MEYSETEIKAMRSGLGAQYAYLPFWTGFTSRTALGDGKYEWSHFIVPNKRCHPIGGTSPIDFNISNFSRELTSYTKVQTSVNGSKYTTLAGTHLAHCLNRTNERMHQIKFSFFGNSALGVEFDNYLLMTNGFPYVSIPESGFANVKTFLKAIDVDYDKLISDEYQNFDETDSKLLIEGNLLMVNKTKLYDRMNSLKLLSHADFITDFVNKTYNIPATLFNELFGDDKKNYFDYNIDYNHLLKQDSEEYENYKDILASCKLLSDAMSHGKGMAGLATSFNDRSQPTASIYQFESANKYFSKSSSDSTKTVDGVLRKNMHVTMNMSFREELEFVPCYAHLTGTDKNGEPMETQYNPTNVASAGFEDIVPFNLAHSNVMRMLDQHGCVLHGGIIDNSEKVLHECFHVLHQDNDNYICSATGLNAPIMSEHELDKFDSLNYRKGRAQLMINPISQSTSFETQGILYVVPKYMLTNSDVDLKFGDHILITGKDQMSLYYTEKGDRLLSPMRAIHGENGVYDIVINSNSFSNQKIQLTGIQNQHAGFMPMRQFIALAIGANRVASTYTISGTNEPLQNPDKPKWVDTWKDNRGYFTLKLNNGQSVDRSDLIHCRECNARVIVYLAQHTNDISGRCPNCDDEDGIQFPHLKKNTKGEK